MNLRKVRKAAWRRSKRMYRRMVAAPQPLIATGEGGVGRADVLALAQAAIADDNYALAVLYHEKAIELWGEDPELWLRVASLQRDMGLYDDAVVSLRRAARHGLAGARVEVETAELQLRRKHYPEAKQSYQRALRLEPDWSLPAERLAALETLVRSEKARDTANQVERVDKEEQLDILDRLGSAEAIDPALFQPTRLELTRNNRPELVLTFIGVHQRTRWGWGPVARGLGSLRGYLVSIVPYRHVQIYIDGRLVHEGELTVGPVRDEQTDARLHKYAFNAWIDYTQFACGWHEVTFRAVGLSGHVEEGVNWKRERLIVEEPLPNDFFAEATLRVPLDAVSNLPGTLVERVRTLPSVVDDASTRSFPGPIRNVVVLRLDGLGDVAVSVPFLLQLRELLPSANIVMVASADNADGCRALGIVDEVIEVDFPESPFKQGRYLAEAEQRALSDRLAAYQFDLAITGMVSDGPRQLTVMTGAPVTIGFGGDDLKSLNIYYDTRDPKSGSNILNYAARYGMLAKALEVWLDSGARVQRRADLSIDLLAPYGIVPEDRFVIMHTGSRIAATEWPGYAALANRIATQLGQKVVYIANDESQKTLLLDNAIADGRIIFIAGVMPFDHFDALLSFCTSFVGNDSGPGHLATLRGAKAIRIISARLGGAEWKSEMGGVCMYRRVPCAGCCSIPISRPEECTFDIACVKDITVDEVYEQVVRLSGCANLDLPTSTRSVDVINVTGETA